MNNATILIAGATGTNGSALLTQFNNAHIKVRAMVRNLDKAADLESEYVELVEGDLAQPETLDAAFDGIEKAYIVTGIDQRTPQWFQSFYEAAKRANVKQLVKFSGMGASTNSASEVIRQHGASDQALIDSGLTYTIIRPNSFHQNMLWQADAIKATKQFYLPLADAKQSTVDVRDLAEATFNILTQVGHENKIYEFSGPEALSFNDVAQILSETTGQDISYIAVPEAAAKQAMLEAGMPEWNAHVLAEIQGVFGTGAYDYVTSDLEQVLGRKSRTFKEFAQDFREAFI